MASQPMPRRSPTAPRHKPQQERAQDTVEIILEATVRVMTKEGYGRTTTNRIAAMAGVSIGTLYRYFPSKDALLAALYRRYSEETLTHIAATIHAMRSAPLAEALRAVIKEEFRSHLGDAPVHRILSERVLQTDAHAHHDVILERYVQLVREELALRRAEIGDVDPNRTAFILVHIIHSLSHAALQHRPAYFTDEVYLEECVQLALSYLTRSSARTEAR